MFVTIFGLPQNVKYQDVKKLIKQQCSLVDMIVDNIVTSPDGTKKVRIGLADDGEAMKLVKGLNGYRLQGNHVLEVVPVGKTLSNPSQQTFGSQQYPPVNEFNQGGDYCAPQRPMEPMNRPQPWGPAVQNTWTQDSPMTQAPQTNFGYPQQGYGQQAPFQSQRPDAPYSQVRPQMEQYGGKPDNRRQIEARSHVLRNVELVDSPSAAQPPTQQGRYPTGPVKDAMHASQRWEVSPNQQGPSHYQGQPHGEPSQSWAHQNQAHYDNDRRGPLDKRDPKALSQMRNPDLKSFPPGRKPSPGRPEAGVRMMQGRPMSPSRPGMHGRMSPGRQSGRPVSPRHGGRMVSPGRGRLERPGSPRTGRPDFGMPNRHSPGRMVPGRPGSPKNYPDHVRPMDSRPGRHMSPGKQHRPISPGRHMPGRPGSPPNRMPGARQIPPGKVSPGRHPMRSGSPGMMRPGRAGSPGKMGSYLSRPISPGGRVGPDQRGIPGRPGSPNMRPGRPGSPRKVGPFPGRPLSPGGRMMVDQRREMPRPGSPGRFGTARPGSPGRRSPHYRPEHGRPGVQPGRQISPQGRVHGPPGRQGSPMRKSSPVQRRLGDRDGSPRRRSPQRYPMDRQHSEKRGFDDDAPSNPTRPTYDSMASSKGMYPSNFRPNVPWQKDEKYPKVDDDRREGRIPPRIIEPEKRVHSERKSRSPVRRDRSPLRDRFKRHSPSPRSPRRSWALEKRRSPEAREAPPPPMWPGQKRNEEQFPRRIPDRMEKEEKGNRGHVWQTTLDNKEIERRREDRRPEQDDRRFAEKGDRHDNINREINKERFAPQNERPNKFSPRETDDRRDFRPYDDKRFNERQERVDFQCRSMDREGGLREELPRNRNPSPKRMDEQTVRSNFDKELEDIYKRAVEFRKKTEELHRSGGRKRDTFSEEHRTPKDDSMKTFERGRRPASPGHRDFHKDSPERRPSSRERVEWKVEQKPMMPDHVKAKRDKALNEILNRLLERQTICDYIEGEFEQRVREELKLEIFKIIQKLFGYEDVSFIEIIIKYQAKYNLKDEELMLRAVLNSLPSPAKHMKRSGPEISEVAAKTARRSSPTALNRGKRYKQAAMTRKPILKTQKRIERAKHEVPIQHRVVTPKQVLATEEKSAKVQTHVKKSSIKRQASLEPPSTGHYELSPVMNRMLDKELQDIMIKVWQQLPDNPSQKAEKMVVEKLRNEAGDDLRNVLGLNVTKRLLNVYNPLFVKVHFTRKPERDHLKAFLVKYRCVKFMRMDVAAKTFSAQMKNIQDFDKICSVKSIRIGNIKVYISPNYDYLKCPPNLKTNFNEKSTNEKETKVLKEIKTNEASTSNKEDVDSKSNINEEKNEEKKEVKSEAKPNPEVKETESKKTTVTNTTPKSVVKAETEVIKAAESKPATIEPAKPAKAVDNIAPNKIVTKSDEVKTDKVTVKPTTPATKTNEASEVKPNKLADKTDKVELTSTKPVDKAQNKDEVKPKVQTVIESKTKVEETKKTALNTDNKPEVSTKIQKETPKTVATKPANAVKKTVTKTEKIPPKATNKGKVSPNKAKAKNKSETMRILEEGDDYDVLDDDDILALISGGVILDECSGSDID